MEIASSHKRLEAETGGIMRRGGIRTEREWFQEYNQELSTECWSEGRHRNHATGKCQPVSLIGIEGLSAHLKEDAKRREDDGKNDLADIAGNQSASDDGDGLRQTARSAQGLKIELTLRWKASCWIVFVGGRGVDYS